jgi:hypothetical protein
VGPADLPNWAFVPLKIGKVCLLLPCHLKNLYSPIRGAGSYASAIVIKLSVMDHVQVPALKGHSCSHLILRCSEVCNTHCKLSQPPVKQTVGAR